MKKSCWVFEMNFSDIPKRARKEQINIPKILKFPHFIKGKYCFTK